MLLKGYGIVRTYEGSYSTNDSIFAKQSFTGYPERMYIFIEYVK